MSGHADPFEALVYLQMPLKMIFWLGGIALVNPTKLSDSEFSASVKITEPLMVAILQMNPVYTHDVAANQLTAKAEIHKATVYLDCHLKLVPSPVRGPWILANFFAD